MIDAQRPVIKSKGPTVDYVRVQLLLASCNCQDEEWERAAYRLEELYLDSIDGMDSLESLTACLAWCLAHLVSVRRLYESDESVIRRPLLKS